MISEMSITDAAKVRYSAADHIAAAITRGESPSTLDLDCYREAVARVDELRRDAETAPDQARTSAS